MQTHPWAWVILQGRTGRRVHLGCLTEDALRNVCKQEHCKQTKSAEAKIIGIHFWSEESQGSVDTVILVLGMVKGALVIQQK